jgi:uncharacterized protein YdeI (YjbR/CyaY-like superfamily)
MAASGIGPAREPAIDLARSSRTPMEPLFFATASEFRKWLKTHHATARELWVGFHKKGSGRPSITWPESVDEALCVGWIDGLRRRIDDESYVIRFTPRKPTSTWSSVNTKRMAELLREGRVRPAGLKAFELRSDEKTALYSYEQRESARFDEASEQQFRSQEAAWKYFQAQAPWYRKTATYWVVSAKKEETRQRRLAQLIEHCSHGRPMPQLARPGATKRKTLGDETGT